VLKPVYFKARGRAQLWCVKHKDLLVVVGGLIIVATFLVKDVLRDQEKDLVDAINSAESTYLIRDANLEVRKELDDIDANVTETRREMFLALPSGQKKQLGGTGLVPGFDGSQDRTVRLLGETDVEVDNLSRLVAKASPTSEHLKEFGELYWQWDKLRMKMFETPLPLLDQKPTEDPKVASQRRLEYYLAIRNINSRIRMVGAEILDDAHYTKEKREHRVSVFAPISYVLFGLGVVVTVVSKLFGIEGEGVAE
jgi:hypothetical protein